MKNDNNLSEDKLRMAIGGVNPALIEESKPDMAKTNTSASTETKKHVVRRWWIAPVAAALAIVITASAVLIPMFLKNGDPEVATGLPRVLAEANYPEQPKFKDRIENEEVQRFYSALNLGRKYYGAGEGLENFFGSLTSSFLSEESAKGENTVFSPLNVYFALSMLAETTGGSSRAQILELIGSDSIETLRKQSKNVWLANYRDLGITESTAGNSVWLNDNAVHTDGTPYEYKKKCLDILASEHFVSSFSGKMGDPAYTKLMKDWLSRETGGLLDEQIGQLKDDDPDLMMKMVSALYYKAGWESEFYDPAIPATRLFKGAKENKVVTMMKSNYYGDCYFGEKFSAVYKDLKGGDGKMLFILPDEGLTPEDLLNDEKALEFIITGQGADVFERDVEMYIPEFDITSDRDLIEGLKKLGVTDCFDLIRADMSPLTDEGAYVGEATNTVRIKVDKQGVVGAAYTIIMLEATSAAPVEHEKVIFTADRPFIFTLLNDDGLPLFVGVVNQV